MSNAPSTLLLGYHGCDRDVGERILSGELSHLQPSENEYDWFGHGIYFWEFNPGRALQFAHELRNNPRRARQPVKIPYVVGAVIEVGNCLNLLEHDSLELLQRVHQLLKRSCFRSGTPLPENTPSRDTGELLRRNLDCAVIELVHQTAEVSYDTVRGVFVEGPPLYPNSGFHEKTHIQICVRNRNAIKGYFRVLPD